MKYILLLLLPIYGFGQNCNVVEQLFKYKSITFRLTERWKRTVIPDEDFANIPEDSHTKPVKDILFATQHAIHDAFNGMHDKKYSGVPAALTSSKYYLQKAKELCPSANFAAWENEIIYYESELKDIREEAIRDSIRINSSKQIATTYSNTHSSSYSTPYSARTQRVSGYRRKNGTYVQSYKRTPRGYRSSSSSFRTRSYYSRGRRK